MNVPKMLIPSKSPFFDACKLPCGQSSFEGSLHAENFPNILVRGPSKEAPLPEAVQGLQFWHMRE